MGVNTIQIPRSQLDIQVLRGPEAFLQCADELDALFLALYGDQYPYLSRKAFAGIGAESSAVSMRYKDRIVGFTAFIHDSLDHRVEIGRLMRHPGYHFEMCGAIADPGTKLFEEYRADPEMLLHGTTRVWIASYYLESLNFTMAGSLVYPAWANSQWGDGLANPFLGLYLFCKPIRAKNTAGLPQWVCDLFPSWCAVFSQHRFSESVPEVRLELSFEALPPEPGTSESSGGDLAWVPCLPNDAILSAVRGLLETGYTLMAFLPSWKRIQRNGIRHYISYLVLERCHETFTSFPESFALTPVHYDFVNTYQCGPEGTHLLYRRSILELFRRNHIPIGRKIAVWLYKHFAYFKIYNLLYEEHDPNQSVSHLFPED